jgi:hypothetical protein
MWIELCCHEFLISRNIVLMSEISRLSRYFAMPQDASWNTPIGAGKILLFFLEGFGRSRGGKLQPRPGNCLLLIRWVTDHGLLLGRKINPRSHTKLHEVARRKEIDS